MSYESVALEDSPKLYLRFGESEGTEAKDSSGNSLAGIYKNSPTLKVAGAIVKDSNTAITLNGTNQYISRAHNSLLNVGDVFTFEVWVKRSENGRQDVIVYKEGTPKTAKFAITTTNKLQLRVPGVKTIVESTSEVKADGFWHHLVVTKNGATVKLYADGVDVTGTVTNETCGNNEGTITIGSENGVEEFFKGSIDEFAIYSVALSKARIEAHFAAGAIEKFEFSPSGSSVSSGSILEELTLIESIAGSSVSVFEESDLFTMEEQPSGVSNSTGENTIKFEELIVMSLNGESFSSWSIEDSFEAIESPSGSSLSNGSEIDIYELGDEVSGSSSSTGSEEQILAVEETVNGTSVSTFSENDEATANESPNGTSISTGSEIDESEAQESTQGSSNSSGSQITNYESPEPEQPTPSPVKPRRHILSVRWKFFLCDSTTMELLGEIKQARGKNLQLALDKPGGCGFSVPLDYNLFRDVEEINHGIIAYRGDTPRYSGMIWNLNEDTENNSIAVQSVGWFETLNHRILRENVGYPPFSTGQINAGQIVFLAASGSVGTTSYHPGGLLTIANAQRDTWLVEGTNKDVMQRIISYQRGQNIGQAITQLSEIEAGFDFWVDPLTRVLDITNWNEVPDKTEDIVFGYNWGNKNIEKLGRQFDPSVMVNRVTALGKFGGGLAEDIESQQKYQLFEEMPQLSDVVDPNVLLGYAGGEVLLRNKPRVLYSFQPFPYSGSKKVPQPFDDYDIGDKISFTAVKPPRIDIRGQAVRIYGMNIDITDEGNEKVTALQISP